MKKPFTNPFRPGAGHQPPYLAGRQEETNEFKKLLAQELILENFVLTGLRGVGKTVLLDTLKPIALQAGWLWVGTDLSESSSITEERIVTRLLTDLAVVTAGITVAEAEVAQMGFGARTAKTTVNLTFDVLLNLYNSRNGLPADKLKEVLQLVWSSFSKSGSKGIIFAYDEAQNLSDHASKEQYPTSLLLDVFQSIQKRNIPFMLLLAGLPTLFPKLVDSRTFAERMFRVVFLKSLSAADSREAIQKPIEDAACPVRLGKTSVDHIVEQSGGYPYFIQFICREAYDAFVRGQKSVPLQEITRKLDSDFFSGRWARATDRQRDLLTVIANLKLVQGEFAVQDIVEKAKTMLSNPFTASHINQMLSSLTESGLVYKNRHGKYSFAVPLLDRFILRQVVDRAS